MPFAWKPFKPDETPSVERDQAEMDRIAHEYWVAVHREVGLGSDPSTRGVSGLAPSLSPKGH